MSLFLNWLDDRTGARGLLRSALYERIPGGARWRYVWGSTLVLAFVSQMVTGVGLWMFYSAGAQSAWESVFFIQYEVQGGWLLRSLHHYMAQVMVVLLAVHLAQVVIDGAYRAPREVNFWLGLILMKLVLALSLTGYLLPWDQKGFWATQVATKISGTVPVVGPMVQRLIVGGSTYGNQTLTRFFALHAGVLPGLLIAVLVVHLALFRRHGIHARDASAKPDATFWPEQVLRDGVAFLAVLAVVLLLSIWPLLVGGEATAVAGEHLGVELGAPADASRPFSAARPEWYFLFLFEMLKLFPGELEVVGAVVVPGLTVLLLFMMPLIGRWQLGHRANVAVMAGLFVAIAVLTGQAMRKDWQDASFQQAKAEAEEDAQRAIELALAPSGIPPTGATGLLRNDPKTVGPQLFTRFCGGCHQFGDMTVANASMDADGDASGAADLDGFASRPWIAGLFDPQRIVSEEYFGATVHVEGEMVGFVQDTFEDVDDETRAQLVRVVAALSAEAALPAQRQIDADDTDLIDAGRELLGTEMGCTDCHRFHDEGEIGSAPDLTGYGSREWLMGIISDPRHESFYGENNDRMPAFLPTGDDASAAMMTDREVGLLADWLRGDWYEAETATESDTEVASEAQAGGE